MTQSKNLSYKHYHKKATKKSNSTTPTTNKPISTWYKSQETTINWYKTSTRFGTKKECILKLAYRIRTKQSLLNNNNQTFTRGYILKLYINPPPAYMATQGFCEPFTTAVPNIIKGWNPPPAYMETQCFLWALHRSNPKHYHLKTNRWICDYAYRLKTSDQPL
jgi:hypothetical protein